MRLKKDVNLYYYNQSALYIVANPVINMIMKHEVSLHYKCNFRLKKIEPVKISNKSNQADALIKVITSKSFKRHYAIMHVFHEEHKYKFPAIFCYFCIFLLFNFS